MPRVTPTRPDFHAFHKSIAQELMAVKDRIRNLVRDGSGRSHWLTDGEWKEAALRTILRRHLPESALLGRGFVVGREYSSTQIDLIILHPGKPALFRDGDLVIISPDAPSALVSVKTKLNSAAWQRAAKELARVGKACKDIGGNQPWLGIFVYEEDSDQGSHILDAVCEAYRDTGIEIHCVASGLDTFVRFWPVGQFERGDRAIDRERARWRHYGLTELAPAYFIANLIDSVCDIDRPETDQTWFAHEGGKAPYRVDERLLDDCRQASGEREAEDAES